MKLAFLIRPPQKETDMCNASSNSVLRPQQVLAIITFAILPFLAVNPAHGGGGVELDVINNFSSSAGGTYFGGHVESEDIYIYFTGGFNTGDITYNGGTNVTAQQAIQLSTVTGGKFTMTSNVNAARAYAILGSSAPATIPVSGPDSVTVTYPYSYIEFTTLASGKGDQSFINQVSFPTTLSNGSQTNTWKSSATAQSVANAFNTAFPTAPYAPAAGVVPESGTPYEPYCATSVGRTSTTPINGHRIIGSSNVNIPSASAPPSPAGTAYTNVPGFNSYLGWLKSNDPGDGWDIAYDSQLVGSGSVYVGKLKVTGTDNNYGIELSGFTYGGTLNADGTMSGGTSVTGKLIYAANNSQLEVYGVPDYTGNWTDMTLFTAAQPVTGGVTTSGDLGGLDTASVLYTVSGAIGAGILGSDAYEAQSSNTNYFFQTGLTPSNALTDFFANSEFGGSTQEGFYDKYWYTMLNAGGLDNGIYAGYFTPYDDHFNTLGVQMASDSGTLTWELGLTTVPEPASLVLLCLGGMAALKRRRANRYG